MLKSKKAIFSQNNAKIHHEPKIVPHCYPDYQHMSESMSPQSYLAYTLNYTTRQESFAHFSFMSQRQEFPSTPTISRNKLFEFKGFYDVSDLSNAHFQLHYTVKTCSERYVLYTAKEFVRGLNTVTGKVSSLHRAYKSKSLDYSPRSNLLIGTDERSVFAVNLFTQTTVPNLQFYPDDEAIGRLHFIRDNGSEYMSVVGNSTNVFIWDFEAQKSMVTLKSHDNVNDLDYNDRSRIYALAEDVREVELMDGRASQPRIGHLIGHQDANFACRFMNEHTLATSGQDLTVRVWDLRKYDRESMLFMGNKSSVYALEYSPKHSLLFALETCSSVQCFSFKKAQIETDKIEFIGFLTGMSLSESENTLYFGSRASVSGIFEMAVIG